jgi:hypothetical protein
MQTRIELIVHLYHTRAYRSKIRDPASFNPDSSASFGISHQLNGSIVLCDMCTSPNLNKTVIRTIVVLYITHPSGLRRVRAPAKNERISV